MSKSVLEGHLRVKHVVFDHGAIFLLETPLDFSVASDEDVLRRAVVRVHGAGRSLRQRRDGRKEPSTVGAADVWVGRSILVLWLRWMTSLNMCVTVVGM
jgi:hypothetical protein